MGFTTNLAKSWVGVSQDYGWWLFCLNLTWHMGLDSPRSCGLACANVCNFMLWILEDSNNMYTPGSALKRTSLFEICLLLGDSFLPSGCQCFCSTMPLGDLLSLCLFGACLSAYPYPGLIPLHLPPASPQDPCPVFPAPAFCAMISWV